METLAVVGAAYVACSVLFTCALLTALGAYRRGRGAGPVLLAAVFFPVVWVVWYLQDTRTLGLARRRVA